MHDELKKLCVRAFQQMKTDRSPYESQWTALADQLSPRRLRFNTSDRNQNNTNTSHIINNTAPRAVRTIVSGLMSGMTSPGRPWFRLFVPGIRDRKALEWLEAVTESISETFIRSNVYQALPILYHDTAIYGTGVAALDEDDKTHIRLRNFAPGSWCISSNHRGEVDSFAREVAMRVREIIQEYGIDNVSDRVRAAHDRGSHDQMFDVIQVIMPSGVYGKRAMGKPYLSVHYEAGETGTDKFLRTSGFEEFPILCPRWEIVDEDSYGYGPGSLALGDAKALQHYEKMTALAVEQNVAPAMMGPAHLAGRGFSMEPYAYNPVDIRDAAGVRPVYESKFPIAEAQQKVYEHERRIQEAFFVDLFTMISNLKGQQPLTAREVDERHEEKLLMLGPVWERLNDELLGPLITRTYAILERRGVLPPPPPSLHNVAFRVEYSSVMAHAMKMVGLANVDAFLQSVLVIAGIKPDVLEKVDMNALIDHSAKVRGVPAAIVVDTDVAKDRIAQREEMAMRQAGLEQAKLASEAAKNATSAQAQSPQGLDEVMQALGG